MSNTSYNCWASCFWVEGTLNIKVSNTVSAYLNGERIVEGTLNIEVSYTFTTIDGNTPSVENTLNINSHQSYLYIIFPYIYNHEQQVRKNYI